MKKKILILFMTVMGVQFMSTVKAQEVHTHCTAHSLSNEILEKDPEAQQRQQELESFTLQFIEDMKNNKSKAAMPDTFIIPCVVHILHTGGTENISDAQIHDAIRIMNRDHQKKNADTSQIIDRFKSIIGGYNVKFVLAKIDPNGNCTNGILRHFTDITNSGDDAQIKSFAWDTRRYYNIYTVRNANGAGGYSYVPATWPVGSNRPGIVCLFTQFGSIGTSQGNLPARTITHETGHFLNLSHTWGQSNDPGSLSNCTQFPNGDQVDDTPQTPGVSGGGCNTNMAGCKQGEIANVQNYMDYAPCEMMFTKGQVARMIAALNSNVGGRNLLWQDSNLLKTGVHPSQTISACAPIADFFIASNNTVCVDREIELRHMMTNASEDSVTFKWVLDGSTTPTSNLKNPKVKYASPGFYDVTLIVSNSFGTDTITKKNFIQVRSDVATIFPTYTQGFEDESYLTDGFEINSPTGGNKWEIYDKIGYQSGKCIYMRNHRGNPSGNEDELLLPKMNFENAGTGKIWLKYYVSYKRRNSSASSNDKLIISQSRDCGFTFINKATFDAAKLATTSGTSSTEYFPQSDADWRKDSVDITSGNRGNANVLFKFINVSSAGNNIYLDNISIEGDFPASINEIVMDNLNLQVYPNPVTNETKIDLFLIGNNTLKITLHDVMGRELSTIANGTYGFGAHSFQLNNAKPLVAGMYFVQVNVNGTVKSHKVLVN